jgi:hypothetical protein
MKKIAIGMTATIFLAGILLIMLILGVGGAGSSPAVAACAPAGGSPVAAGTNGDLPTKIGPYQGEQVANAAEIIAAAQVLGLSERAQVIGVMTAIGESTLRNLDFGDAVGPDSRGLFQQRGNGAWGTYEDRMNPRTAATNFFQALIKVPTWESMPPTLAAHETQRNADPWHYEKFWLTAVQIVGVLGRNPDLASQLPTTGGLPCAPGGAGTFTGVGGAMAPESCSVVPDPTTGRGCLTPRSLALVTQLKAQGYTSISCWDPHLQNPNSDHPLGRGCDIFPGSGGKMPSAAEKTKGDALAAALQASAKETGVNYLIWYGQIWSVARSDEGWRPYNGGGVYDSGDVTGGHFDHIHISVY